MPATQNPPSIRSLVEALGSAAGPLDEIERRLALSIYRLLAARDPVTHRAVAAATDLSEAEVSDRLAPWPGVFRDEDGAIVGFWGLAIEPLDPAYELRDAGSGEPLGYAWCAWDTLFLPALLGRTLSVTSGDGLTGEPVTLNVGPDGARDVHPPATVVSVLAPEGPWRADILATFCHKVLFFTDRHSAERWMASQPDDLFTLTVEDAFEVGRLWAADRYGAALAG